MGEIDRSAPRGRHRLSACFRATHGQRALFFACTLTSHTPNTQPTNNSTPRLPLPSPHEAAMVRRRGWNVAAGLRTPPSIERASRRSGPSSHAPGLLPPSLCIPPTPTAVREGAQKQAVLQTVPSQVPPPPRCVFHILLAGLAGLSVLRESVDDE